MILVTGSAGMIGTALCERLLAENIGFIGLDKNHSSLTSAVKDLTKFPRFSESHFLNKIDTIVHLAANARVYPLIENPNLAIENAVMTDNVYQLARKFGIKRVLIASSREVYGDMLSNRNTKLTEKVASHYRCTNPYAAAKLHSEALAYSYKTTDDIDSVITRFSNVYGKYDYSDRFIPLTIKKINNSEVLYVYGGKEKSMDFTYIDDVVDAIVFLLFNFDKAKISNENDGIYNVSPGKGYSLYYVATKLSTLIGKPIEIIEKSNRLGEPMYYVADVQKIKLMGFECKTRIDDGLKKSVDFYLPKNN